MLEQRTEGADEASSDHFWLMYGLAILLLSLGCVGSDMDVGEAGVCGDSATQWTERQGDERTLGFHHVEHGRELSTQPRYFSFNPRIPEGYYNDYEVSYWDDRTDARLDYVESSDRTVLDVEIVEDNWFEVYARQPGTAELEVVTTDGYTDYLELEVTDLDRVDPEHCCTNGERATYLTNSEIQIPVDYRDRSGDRAIGYGDFPFEISDESRLEWRNVNDPSSLILETGSRSGQVELAPTVDGSPVSIDLIEPDDVDGISIDWVEDDVEPDIWFVGPVLYQDSEAICSGNYPVTLETRTPETCELLDADGRAYTWLDVNADEEVMVRSYTRNDRCRIRAELYDEHGDLVLDQTSSERLR